MSDLNTRRGRIMGVDSVESHTVVKAHVPLAECQRYASDMRSITQGRGTFAMNFSHYEDVPVSSADDVRSRFKAGANTGGCTLTRRVTT